MHIPDGFLDGRTCVGTYCLAGAGLAWAARRVSAQWSDRTVPMLGVMSAFVFAGQMVNFPIPGATSGHLMGGTLAAILLGPSAAALSLTTVLVVQSLFFQDGGITSLGANALNMALISVWGGYLIYRAMRSRFTTDTGRLAAAGVAAWCSVVLAAATCGLELALAGLAPFRFVFSAMVLTHALIGIGEAMITTAVLGFVLKVRGDLLYDPTHTAPVPVAWRNLCGYGLLASAGVALLVAPLASVLPDGLEKVAHQFGFEGRAHSALSGPMPGYATPWIHWPWLSTGLPALVGVVLTFGLACFGAWTVARRSKSPRYESRPPGSEKTS